MSWSWKIQKAAVEQEILFPSEKVYEDCLAKLIGKEEPFEIVDEKENADGTYTVIMRKKYNNNPFFRKEEEFSDEQFKKFIRTTFEDEVEQLMAEVEANQEFKDVQAPPEIYDKLMARIRYEEIKEKS